MARPSHPTMTQMEADDPGYDATPGGRRQALVVFVAAALGGIGGVLAAIAGAFAAPVRAQSGRGQWRRAAALSDLSVGQPFAATVQLPVQDGWRRARVPQTLFLVREGADSVRAFSATCTHLGCRVSFDPESRRFACPCHGGYYDVAGQVVAGPPPTPLATIEARVVADRDEVLVRL
jgi:Rieske Fe-S protein